MIVLKRNETIEVYQVELVLKVKTKQSPFIAVLMLALELEEISAASLQQNLLASLPVRACENLLNRLEQQGYLKKENKGWNVSYVLTDYGHQSATDKSYWIGEKGVYNVFVSNSNLFEQKIIKIEKVDRAEDDRNNNILNTPREIRKYEKQVLLINKSEAIIEDIEAKCFNLKPLSCELEIISNDNETTIKITNNNQNLFSTDFQIDEVTLQEELLTASKDFDYDSKKKIILIPFNKDNLSYNRKTIINNPIFKNNTFQSIELEAMLHIPSDSYDADLWYNELLFKNLNKYYLDEDSFSEYADGLISPLNDYYRISSPYREDFLEQIKERTDAFYQIAKIETIDYLNY